MKTLFIEPGSPWENGYVESFNGKLRDELLDREVFDTLLEAKVLIERWRRSTTPFGRTARLGYRPPAPEAIQPGSFASATPQQTNRLALGQPNSNLKTGSIPGGRSAFMARLERTRTPHSSDSPS